MCDILRANVYNQAEESLYSFSVSISIALKQSKRIKKSEHDIKKSEHVGDVIQRKGGEVRMGL